MNFLQKFIFSRFDTSIENHTTTRQIDQTHQSISCHLLLRLTSFRSHSFKKLKLLTPIVTASFCLGQQSTKFLRKLTFQVLSRKRSIPVDIIGRQSIPWTFYKLQPLFHSNTYFIVCEESIGLLFFKTTGVPPIVDCIRPYWCQSILWCIVECSRPYRDSHSSLVVQGYQV